MRSQFGAWATLIDTAGNPRLSAFWRRRMTMLPAVSNTASSLTRCNLACLALAGLLLGVLPTFRAGAGVAEDAAAKPAGVASTTAGQQQDLQRAIHVRVVGPNGKPMVSVKVHVAVWTKEPFDHNRDYLTDPEGRATAALPHTLYILRLWARADGYVPLFAHWEEDWLAAGRRLPDEFTFKLRKGTTIGGVVNNDDGRPIAGAKVEVSLALNIGQQQNQPIDDVWLATGDDACTTDVQGRWSLNNGPEGRNVYLGLAVSHLAIRTGVSCRTNRAWPPATRPFRPGESPWSCCASAGARLSCTAARSSPEPSWTGAESPQQAPRWPGGTTRTRKRPAPCFVMRCAPMRRAFTGFLRCRLRWCA